ncbi:MAG: hypothetical protein ACRDP3_02655 [Streptomyces sp.]|uniref:hypothetical protein n=1 Tax=Streptomyces sp. TaxID=1931 RepID=UPI003D6C2CFA
MTPSWARNAAAGAEVHPADRLASVLDALVAEQTAMPHAMGAGRAGRLPGQTGQSAELPGEAAAIEAFRVAHAEIVHSGTVDISAGPTESGTVVGRQAVREDRRRSGRRRSGAPRRLSLGGRPLRAGFAMAVAGCALGGAAVAAGTGVLPTPWGNGAPAASVSPLASPDASEREAAAGGRVNPGDSHQPTRGPSAGGSSASSGSADDGLGHGGDGPGQTKDKKSKSPKDDKGNLPGTGDELSDAEKQAIARDLCEEYESGKLSASDRLKLERAAGGADVVREFCEEFDDGHEGGDEDDGDGDADGGSDSGSTSNSGGVGTPSNSGGTGDPGGTGDSGGTTGGDSGGDSGGATGSDGDSRFGGSPTPTPTGSPTDPS